MWPPWKGRSDPVTLSPSLEQVVPDREGCFPRLRMDWKGFQKIRQELPEQFFSIQIAKSISELAEVALFSLEREINVDSIFIRLITGNIVLLQSI